jgi:predicted small secreted protein
MNAGRKPFREATMQKQNPVSRFVLILAASAMTLISVTACNTMEGAGKDVERAGEKVQDAAD